MRLLQSLIRTGLVCALTASAVLQAQTPIINGPMLGLTSDAGGSTIWPIIGIPGAAILATRLTLSTDIRRAVISPKQDYAIAVRWDDARAAVIDLTTNGAITSIPGVLAGNDAMALSPTG